MRKSVGFREVVELLKEDAVANGKPCSVSGILRGYLTVPGIYLMSNFRLGQYFSTKGLVLRVISKILWLRIIRKTGCHFSFRADVGGGLALPHATGVVVGDGAVIGKRVTLFQHVTVGQRAGAYPMVGDGVVVYPGAVLVGGIGVGAGAVIGALSFVANDVASGDTVAGSPAKRISGGARTAPARSA